MRTILLLLVYGLTGFSFSQTYTIRIKIDSLPAGPVYLADFNGDKNRVKDTCETGKGGWLTCMLPATANPGLYRLIMKDNHYLDFVFNFENIEMKTCYDYPVDSMQVISSKENSVYFDFLQKGYVYNKKINMLLPLVDDYPRDDFYKDIRKQYLNIKKEYEDYFTRTVGDHPDAFATKLIKIRRPLFFDLDMKKEERFEWLKQHYFDGLDLTDVTLLRTNAYTTLAIDYLGLYSNPNFSQPELEDSFVQALDVMMDKWKENRVVYDYMVEYLTAGFDKFHFEKVLEHIAKIYLPEESCENEDRKKDLQTRLEKFAELATGKQAPDIEMTTLDGKLFKLADEDAEYTLLMFWASWCPHCAQMIPDVAELYKQVGSDKLQIVAISLDTSRADWEKSISEHKLTWINCCDLQFWNGKAVNDYNIYATPTMFLLDRKKVILAKPITFQELINALAKVKLI
jgi:peroxiredoxin